MYYEEKVVNGILCWRSGPRDEWTPFGIEALTNRVGNLERALRVYESKEGVVI